MMKITIRSIMILLAMSTFAVSATAQKKVKNFKVSKVINAPAEKVWAAVGADYGAIAKSHPKIIASDYINGSQEAKEGAERVCYFNEKQTQYLEEQMVDFDPENYTFKNTVRRAGKFPVDPEYTFAIYKIVPIDAEACRFDFDMTYRTKPAFLGSMMKRSFVGLINDYAIAIEHFVNTNEPVTKENFKEIKKMQAD